MKMASQTMECKKSLKRKNKKAFNKVIEIYLTNQTVPFLINTRDLDINCLKYNMYLEKQNQQFIELRNMQSINMSAATSGRTLHNELFKNNSRFIIGIYNTIVRSFQIEFYGVNCLDGTMTLRTIEASFFSSYTEVIVFIQSYIFISTNKLNRKNLPVLHDKLQNKNNAKTYNYNLINVIEAVKKILFDKNVKAKIALHSLFIFWPFQNVTQGILLHNILRKYSMRTFCTISGNNRLVLIKKFNYISLNFNYTIPIYITDVTVDMLHGLSLWGFYKLDLPLLFDRKSVNDNVCTVIYDYKHDALEMNGKQYDRINTNTNENRFTQFNGNSDLVNIGTSTEENNLEMDEAFSINFYNNYLQYLNSKLWVPHLCGDSYEDKIGYMAYILKCSCLDESLLNLDKIEEYTWEMTNLLTSTILYKRIFKDLCKSIWYLLFNSTI